MTSDHSTLQIQCDLNLPRRTVLGAQVLSDSTSSTPAIDYLRQQG
jgi:hypothetical protein